MPSLPSYCVEVWVAAVSDCQCSWPRHGFGCPNDVPGVLVTRPMTASALPATVAGRIDFVMQLLEGFPVFSECSCGCGLETYVGHEPAITKADAARMLEGL